ncbi:MAG: DUF2752 domain-containing protein [Planctomycetota bacterium]
MASEDPHTTATSGWIGERNVLITGLFVLAIIPLGPLPALCPSVWFGYPACPTCGVTRAVQASLRGDLVAAWNLNPIGLLLLIVVAKRIVELSSRRFRDWYDGAYSRCFDTLMLTTWVGIILSRMLIP